MVVLESCSAPGFVIAREISWQLLHLGSLQNISVMVSVSFRPLGSRSISVANTWPKLWKFTKKISQNHKKLQFSKNKLNFKRFFLFFMILGRIRIRNSRKWIRGSGSVSKWNESETLVMDLDPQHISCWIQIQRGHNID